jgi:hypothetical protein
MALVAAAVCPHPPLLIPSVGLGIDVPARTAAQATVARLVATEPDRVVLVGNGPEQVSYGPADAGSLAGFGVDEVVPLGPRTCGEAAVLPLSITVGAWLLGGTGWTGNRQAVALPESLSADDAAALGTEIAELDERVALLCLGDGSARRSDKAPGWFDPRAEPFDRTVAVALAEADLAALRGLDPELARELLVAGRTSWQVLAGAAAGQRWSGTVSYDEAPFGVGYFVAGWTPAAQA